MEELLYYCFNNTFSDIQTDVKENSKSTIEEKIASEKKAGSCQCETKNPRGR
jgi:hypothetical protein